ncbi:hypothetical protein [Tunturiibacter lichenicola]|uniref:hypothetical protein n=1 Tax=Tunturiibacter lichenicola TaxID=2051959 RepID=UPI003D9B43F4
MYIVLTIGLISVFSSHPLWAQRTIHVPGDASTIQAGINTANAGDTVSIGPGTYFGPINFNGKAIIQWQGDYGERKWCRGDP